MRIQSVQTFTPKINFKSAATINTNINTNYNYNINNDNNSLNNGNNNSGCIPSWLRKGVIAALTVMVLEDDPTIKNLMKPYEQIMEDETKTEYFEKVHEFGDSTNLYPAVYHLNRIVDVDNAKITHLHSNNYNLKINLDNKSINTTISLYQCGENSISGYIKTNQWPFTRYKAIFSKDNPQEFEIHMVNKNRDKYTFGRTSDGGFYQVVNGEKIILNKKNVEKYQEKISNLEYAQNDEFFHRINLLLLSLVFFSEAMREKARRKEN